MLALPLREKATDSAILIYQKALTASQLSNYRYGIAKALQGLGRCYSNKNEQDKALGYLRSALHYNDSSAAGRELAIVDYLILSEAFYNKGQLDSCAWYRYEALNELESGKPQSAETQMRVYGKILHFWMNAHEDVSNDPFVAQVMGHVNELEQIAVKTKDSSLLENVCFYKAGYYVNTKQYDSAHIYSNRSLAISRITKVASPSVIMAMLINIANTYLEEKKPIEAIAKLEEAASFIPLSERANNRYVILSEIFLGEAYLQLEQFQKAVDITKPALEKAEALKLVRNTERPHKTLADAYEALGDFKQAAFHRKEYVSIRDSMMKEENLEIIYNTEMKYRIADREKALVQKELIIAQNESRIKTKNTWIIFITSVFVLISVLGFLLYRNKSHKEKLQSEKLRNLQQETEISRLNAMITGEEKERSRIARDLHDGLGGTMGAIRTRLSTVFRKHKTTDVTNDFVEVMQMMEEASMELRKTAHNLMPEVLLQEGLVKATELYCERVSKDRGLAINFETWGTQERLKPDFELAVYRIIQELVHNVLKHAHASQAIVQITFHETQLCITVEDDGVGMSGKQSDGMGLKAIKERVIPLNGQINIESGFGKGTSIYLEFTITTKRQAAPVKEQTV